VLEAKGDLPMFLGELLAIHRDQVTAVAISSPGTATR
jgi:hypothetical protein